MGKEQNCGCIGKRKEKGSKERVGGAGIGSERWTDYT